MDIDDDYARVIVLNDLAYFTTFFFFKFYISIRKSGKPSLWNLVLIEYSHLWRKSEYCCPGYSQITSMAGNSLFYLNVNSYAKLILNKCKQELMSRLPSLSQSLHGDCVRREPDSPRV